MPDVSWFDITLHYRGSLDVQMKKKLKSRPITIASSVRVCMLEAIGINSGIDEYTPPLYPIALIVSCDIYIWATKAQDKDKAKTKKVEAMGHGSPISGF